MTQSYTDAERIAFLAGCGSDDGPVVEGFVSVLDDFYSFVGDAAVARVGLDEYAKEDFEPTDADLVNGFRAMVDAAIDAERKKREELTK